MAHLPEGADVRSGYCSSDGIYYSNQPPVWIPEHLKLDLLSFMFAPQVGSKVALIESLTGKFLAYRELWNNVRAVAAGLYKAVGVSRHDAVLLLLLNSIDFPVLFLAVVLLAAQEVRKQMKDAGTKFIVTSPRLMEKIAGITSSSPRR